MADIVELERRIRAALDRIGASVESMAPGGAAAGDDAAAGDAGQLRSLLENERMANAQLEERLKTLHQRHEALEAEKDAAVAALRRGMADLDTELQKLRKANDMLRDSNAALRAANAEGVGEAHLINKAMLTELESIRAARAADAAEARALLAAIEPLLAEAAATQDNRIGEAG